VGPGGSGNFVKMVHNGIEYGDMQLISEAYDVLRSLGGFSNAELAETFKRWNEGELQSYLVEITSIILAKQDDRAGAAKGALVDRIVDKTGAKGTGKWTVQRAAELSVPAPTIAASLDGRYISALKDERVAAAAFYDKLGLSAPATASDVDKAALAEDVRKALYCAKVCSYAQGMNIIRAQSEASGWAVDLGGLARIWKGGCIIRAAFLDRIKQAYRRDPALPNLLVDADFAREIADQQGAWRRVVALAATRGVSVAGMSSSLAYFDAYRRARLPANLVQAQRDFFGSHTYERDDAEGWHHTVWDERYGSADSITTKAYGA
jgi:6-phosphogluconate dehydrogenase